MENFNKKHDHTKATNSLDGITMLENVKSADVPFEKYKKLKLENEVLQEVIVKLTIKVVSLEKELNHDTW